MVAAAAAAEEFDSPANCGFVDLIDSQTPIGAVAVARARPVSLLLLLLLPVGGGSCSGTDFPRCTGTDWNWN